MKAIPSKNRLCVVDSTSSKDLGARFRKIQPGPELDLIEAFLREIPLHIPHGCRATVFREPRLESGFPDLVIVVWREHITRDWNSIRLSLKALDLRLMHFLYYRRRAHHNEIIDYFGQHATKNIERLYEASMIQPTKSYWTPCPLNRTFAASKIIAVEAKVGKWTEVLNQAMLNTWFASKSYALVPNHPSMSQIASAKRLGIGVCSLDGRKIREVASTSTRLPKSYASWVFNDWAWKFGQMSEIK